MFVVFSHKQRILNPIKRRIRQLICTRRSFTAARLSTAFKLGPPEVPWQCRDSVAAPGNEMAKWAILPHHSNFT